MRVVDITDIVIANFLNITTQAILFALESFTPKEFGIAAFSSSVFTIVLLLIYSKRIDVK